MDIDSNAALGAAIQHAAGELKEGQEISISIENGGYAVSLIVPSPGNNHYPDNDNIIDDILECVRVSGGGLLEVPDEPSNAW